MKPTMLISILAFGSLVGCDEAAEEVSNIVDCEAICDRYEDCYNEDFDQIDCIERCEDEADADAAADLRIEVCSECIDQYESCAEGSAMCSTECEGVLNPMFP